MGEIDPSKHQDISLFRGQQFSESIDKRSHAGIIAGSLARRDHLVKGTDQYRRNLVTAHSQRVGEKQRLEFNRVFRAMENLVREQVSSLVSCGKPIDKISIGFDWP